MAAFHAIWGMTSRPPTRGGEMKVLLEKSLAEGVSLRLEAPIIPDAPEYGDVDVTLVKAGAVFESLAEQGKNALPGVLKFSPDGAVFPTPLRMTITWPDGVLSEAQAAQLGVVLSNSSPIDWRPLLVRDRDVQSRRLVVNIPHFSFGALFLHARRVTALSIEQGLRVGRVSQVELKLAMDRTGPVLGTMPHCELRHPDRQALAAASIAAFRMMMSATRSPRS